MGAPLRAEARRAITFGLVGVANTVVDVAVFVGLRQLGAALLLANTAGFLAGSVNSYLLNGLVTFRDRGARLASARTMTRFAAVVLATLGISNLVVWAGALVMPVALAKAASILATFAAGLVLNRLLVFRPAG